MKKILHISLVVLLCQNGVVAALCLARFGAFLFWNEDQREREGKTWMRFTIENQANEAIQVTPIVEGREKRPARLIDESVGEGREVMSPRRARFDMLPGRRITFTYNYDDHSLSTLVVETASGERRQMPLPPATSTLPANTPGYPPPVIAVPSVAGLSPITPDVDAALQQALIPYVSRPREAQWRLLMPLAPLSVLAALVWLTRSQKEKRPGATGRPGV